MFGPPETGVKIRMTVAAMDMQVVSIRFQLVQQLRSKKRHTMLKNVHQLWQQHTRNMNNNK